MFSSLSKRSNVPGMRSGFVAGDAEILKKFLLYRTYQGCAMSPPVQAASIVAWQDEAHVVENRRLYREKFDTALEILKPALDVDRPDAAFYLWARTPGSDTSSRGACTSRRRYRCCPEAISGAKRTASTRATNRVRIALVASTEECAEAARRIRAFVEELRTR